jgi:hypothetical protein
MPLTLGRSCCQAPEYDLGFGWEGLLILVGLAGEAATGLFLFAGEGSDSGGLGQQMPVVGDLEDDVVDELTQVRRGKKPSRH